MDNNLIKKELKKKLKYFSRITNKYKFKNVKNYNDLTPFTYTILLKPAIVKTIISNKVESKVKYQRGDYVMCGPKNEKYGLSLDKILNTYNLGIIENKKVIRKGFQIKKKMTKKNEISITPSWGGVQNLKINDYILLELDKKNYYGIDQKSFKKTYKNHK